MRALRFGIVALVLSFALCGGFVLRMFYRVALPPPVRRATTVTDKDVKSAKANLCRLARSEHAFYRATGHYADESELSVDNNVALPLSSPIPYFYFIRVPVLERFAIVAVAYGPLQQQPPALVVDDRLQLCTVRSDLPNVAWQLDSPPQHWGRISYDCEICP